MYCFFFFSSRRRHTMCALVTGVQTCALPITHYKDLQQSVPASSDFARLFLAPGTYHCGGGTGPQDVPDRALETVIAWRERGIAPDTIIGTGPSVPEGLPDGMPVRPAPDAVVSQIGSDTSELPSLMRS